MPTLEFGDHDVPDVARFGSFLNALLEEAEIAKPELAIEPPLDKTDFPNLQDRLVEVLPTPSLRADETAEQKKSRRFAIIETAVRELLSTFIATTSIESPEFNRVWNLFDVLSILSDSEQCDPALLFWLVEELLDSQTIAGCRKIFDYLESRRERITSKHFKQKQLVILRSCNELLRRLSRAEDTTFCGRVFIFMFQSFPLGDKSSVNLRGEYHVENVTVFSQETPAPTESAEKMEVDPPVNGLKKGTEENAAGKSVSVDGKKQPEKPLDPDTLYPVFWSLQESFSQPKRLFDAAQFTEFKSSLEATMTKFRSIKADSGAKPARQEKQPDERSQTLKRKREDVEDEMANAFNPKYLTSRDLFELEISDLSFRRHVLVQALIIMDFLLSLSAKAKEKLATLKTPTPNKSVTYSDQLLSEEDTQWALDTKRNIAEYLKQGNEGPYFYRMVETVLTRDKNWSRWKIEGCPPIEIPAVSPEQFAEAKGALARSATSKRLRPYPMNSINISFLGDGDEAAAWDRLKARDRYAMPDLKSFEPLIEDDQYTIDSNSPKKAAAIEGKASKSWRALRIASKTKLAVFDKIDNPEKIDIIFQDAVDPEDAQGDDAEAADPPADSTPIILTGPDQADVSSVAALLLERKPGVFAKVARHTTRQPSEGEKKGEFQFVDDVAFNSMRDSDYFIEFNDEEPIKLGTNRKAVDAIRDSGKIPLLQMDPPSLQQVEDNGFSARIFYVQLRSTEELEGRWKDAGKSTDELQQLVAKLGEDLQLVKAGDFHKAVLVEGDEDAAYSSLEGLIYVAEANEELENGGTETEANATEAEVDVSMKDATA